MALKIYNTLSRKVEEFVPMNVSDVGMYNCGPTPYDYQHIGNFRTAIFADVLYRVLAANGYKVKTVRNITDIEDKIIKKSEEMGITPDGLTEEFTKLYFQDLNKLNILPTDVSPKATEHIQAMVKYIEVLVGKGVAYVEQDGSVYFDISKFPDYGKLSQLDKRELKTGTRVLSDEYDKENIQDFALWKSVGPDEFGYDSPWGKGRPGWHIECSVMSQEFLGDTFDIHTGGVDLIFPHHENEIAQSEAKTQKKFVNYFVHAEHLLVDGKKMAKSAKNFYTLKDLEEKSFDPMAFRYLALTAHYRDPLNFTWESLQSAQNALSNLREIVREWESEESEESKDFYGRFLEALYNDLNTSQALAVMWELVKSNLPGSEKAETLLRMDQVLGLGLENYIGKKVEIPEEVQKLVDQRERARVERDFERSDKLRSEIQKLGFEVLDTPEGPKVKKLIP
jgi:cysteinyl-tRNA synthetase